MPSPKLGNRDAVAAGEVPGAFWALMTHPKADQALQVLAYEEVHMLSHQVGAGMIADTRLLAETRTEYVRCRREAAQESRRARATLDEHDRRIAMLEESAARLPGVVFCPADCISHDA